MKCLFSTLLISNMLMGLGCGDATQEIPQTLPLTESPSADPSTQDPPQIPRLFVVDAKGDEVSGLRYGEPFALRITGATPNAEITMYSALWGYRGEAKFRVPPDGIVDTSEDASVAGTYLGTEADGLVWSMNKQNNEVNNHLNISFEAQVGDTRLRTTFQRSWLDEGITRSSVEHEELVATTFRPTNATGELPAILVLGGSEGGIESAEFQATWLAAYGYTTMALAYFGVPGLPNELQEIPLEYFEEALDTLASYNGVDAHRIGVIGGSRGGEAALMLGAQFPIVSAVVAQVPSGLRWGATSGLNTSGWSYQNEVLAFVPTLDMFPQEEILASGAIAYRTSSTFQNDINAASTSQLNDASIRVEQSQGPILLLGGSDDGIWPSCDLAQRAMERLIDSAHAEIYNDEFLCFADAGHFVAQPGWPTTQSYWKDFGSYNLVFGGSTAGNGRAQRQSLAKIRAFFEAEL